MDGNSLADEDISATIAVVSRLRNGERRRVEPSVVGSDVGGEIAVGDTVRQSARRVGVGRIGAGESRREVASAGEGRDRLKIPASEDPIDNTRRRRQEMPALPDR